jgi:Ribosomal protein L14
MVQIRSRLDVADNTGARMATMIGVIGKATLYARIGDVITANVKEASATGTVKKGRGRASRHCAHETAGETR